MDKTPYEQWTAGDYAFPSGFQLLIFRVYQHAGGDNQRILETVYPKWFTKPDALARATLNAGIYIEFVVGKELSRPQQVELDKFDIPFNDTEYIELNELSYPLVITDENAFLDIILNLKRKPDEKTHH